MATSEQPLSPQRHPFDRAKSTLDLLLYRLGLRTPKFRGAFASHEVALAAVRPGRLAGYDNEAIVDDAFERMCRLELRDWPVLYWLRRLGSETRCLLDVGGHQGTKYRAFGNHLELGTGIQWIVYDVPAVVRAGRDRCARDGLIGLSFIDNLSDAPDIDVVLASGVLQYLDVPFGELLRRLPTPPRHLVLNKVATRTGPTVVTLENFGCADVPYHIRDYTEFLSSLDTLGYDVVDKWQIPELSHIIPTHPDLGSSASFGFYAKWRDDRRREW